MEDLYNELYSKIPENVAQPINVANPTPLYNSTVIKENGKYDVSSFAVAKIDVEGGGGGGNSATPVLDVTITNNDERECSFNGDFICIENNQYLSYNVWHNPINPNQSEEFLVPVVSYDSGSSYLFYLPSPYDSSVTITLADAVNCTYDENNHALSITDPSENASCTVIYE